MVILQVAEIEPEKTLFLQLPVSTATCVKNVDVFIQGVDYSEISCCSGSLKKTREEIVFRGWKIEWLKDEEKCQNSP